MSEYEIDQRSRAMLRRTDPFEVRGAYVWATKMLSIPAFHGRDVSINKLVSFAPVVALVREDSNLSLGKALKAADVNERHVRRLLSADRTDIDDQLEKIIRLLNRKANIADLVVTQVFWGESTARRIAMDYFGVDEHDDAAEMGSV